MRRITVFCLTLALMLLGLARLAAAQNVTIDLTPITYPIVLPDSGGSFDYLLTVTNQGSAITATIWCMVVLPNGSSWGPVVGPATRTLDAGQTQSYYRTQTIPSRAPYGYFMLHAYVGIYPDTVWAQGGFEFQRQGISGTEQLWAARYNGPGNTRDEAYALEVDGEGNVYVTGNIGEGAEADYGTIKYDANGIQLWVACYNGPGNGNDYAYSLGVDGGGNVFVTGSSDGQAGWGYIYDYATIKYNAWGNQVWAVRYNGPGNSQDEAISLAMDDGGNVYVTGQSYGSGTHYDYATIKYDTAGSQLWVSRYNGLQNSYDHARSLAVDGRGNVYVTGFSNGQAGDINYDYATVKYNASGNQIWVARYNGPGNGNDYAYSLAVDGDGNVYVTGESWGGYEIWYDYATVKYDSSGNQIWVGRYNGPGNSDDGAYSLTVDGRGNVYVTGFSDGQAGSGHNYDYATVKYDASGNQVWVARYNGAGNFDDGAYSLTVDDCGNVYVTGNSYGSGTFDYYDYATIKYDAGGNQVWVARYNGPGNDNDVAHSLTVDGGGNIYVTGYSNGSGTNYDYTTIKYSGSNVDNWMPVEATVLGQPLPQECRLEPNFPNPFNASTAISFELRAASHVSLRIYDTAGRLVETLVDGWRSAGTHELTWNAGDLPSGMYVYRIRAGDWTGSGKMVLIK